MHVGTHAQHKAGRAHETLHRCFKLVSLALSQGFDMGCTGGELLAKKEVGPQIHDPVHLFREGSPLVAKNVGLVEMVARLMRHRFFENLHPTHPLEVERLVFARGDLEGRQGSVVVGESHRFNMPVCNGLAVADE